MASCALLTAPSTRSTFRAAASPRSTLQVTGTGLFQGTNSANINAPGAIAGYTLDASNVYHGFLRARDGTITTFDAPGASTGSFEGTIPFSNNPVGVITGYYTDSSGVIRGFLRIP